jgi:hypothetical protein
MNFDHIFCTRSSSWTKINLNWVLSQEDRTQFRLAFVRVLPSPLHSKGESRSNCFESGERSAAKISTNVSFFPKEKSVRIFFWGGELWISTWNSVLFLLLSPLLRHDRLYSITLRDRRHHYSRSIASLHHQRTGRSNSRRLKQRTHSASSGPSPPPQFAHEPNREKCALPNNDLHWIFES